MDRTILTTTRMANLFSRAFEILIGEAGPADMVVTRHDESTHFRMPNQCGQPRDVRIGWLVAALVGGPVLIYVVIAGTLAYEPEDRDLDGMYLFIAAIVGVMALIYCQWRKAWHHEILLRCDELQLMFVETFTGRSTLNVIKLEPIRQFTVIQHGLTGNLQAESATDDPVPILNGGEAEFLTHLAELLALERARLDPGAPVIPIAVEAPAIGVERERTVQPLHSRIALTRNERGITLDWPELPDPRQEQARKAWRSFQLAIALLVGALLAFMVLHALDFPDIAGICAIPFIGGLAALLAAASHGISAAKPFISPEANMPRQIAFAGNLLVRTGQDQSKQLWYKHEIAALAIEEEVETQESSSGENGQTTITQLQWLRLVVRLHNGEKFRLYAICAGYPVTDYRYKAEVEWIATQLRQALGAKENTETPTIPRLDSQAIQDMSDRTKETRISS
jgi:hypothetical protein